MLVFVGVGLGGSLLHARFHISGAPRSFLKSSPQPGRPGQRDLPASKELNPSVPRRQINFTLNDPQRGWWRMWRMTGGARRREEVCVFECGVESN